MLFCNEKVNTSNYALVVTYRPSVKITTIIVYSAQMRVQFKALATPAVGRRLKVIPLSV